MGSANSISILNICSWLATLKLRVDVTKLLGALLQSKIVDYSIDVRNNMCVHNPGMQISSFLTYSNIRTGASNINAWVFETFLILQTYNCTICLSGCYFFIDWFGIYLESRELGLTFTRMENAYYFL